MQSFEQEERQRAEREKEIKVQPVQEPSKLEEPSNEDEIPEGTLCTMMCSEIPKGFAIMLNDQPFDARYFIKGMITQKEPFSPYTKTPLTPDELKNLCNIFKIDPTQFLDVWNRANTEMNTRYGSMIDRQFESAATRILTDLTVRIFMAQMMGNVPEFNRLNEQARARLMELPDPKVQKLEKAESLKKEFLKDLIHQARLQGKITPQFEASFIEVL